MWRKTMTKTVPTHEEYFLIPYCQGRRARYAVSTGQMNGSPAFATHKLTNAGTTDDCRTPRHGIRLYRE